MEKLLEKEKGIDSKRASEKGPLLDLLIHDLTGPLSVVSKSAASLSQEESRFGPGSPICGEEVRDLYLERGETEAGMDLWIYRTLSDFYSLFYSIFEKEGANDRVDLKKILDSFEFIKKK